MIDEKTPPESPEPSSESSESMDLETEISEPSIEITEEATEAKPQISEEELKHLKRQRLLKMFGLVYFLLLLFIFFWAMIFGQKTLTFFNVLPISQAGFQAFLYKSFLFLWGALLLVSAVVVLRNLFKSIRIPSDHLEEKKHWSKKAMLSGFVFLGLAVLMVVFLFFLNPRLLLETKYSSYIITDPEDTIGLTAPVEVNFDATQIPFDKEKYRILSYTWDFGDGETGNGVVVTHVYESKSTPDGSFTVTLKVNFMSLETGDQFSQEFQTEVVVVNEKVNAKFTATPDSGLPPLEVEFDASGSSDPDGQIVKWEWDFDGDGKFDDGTGEETKYEFTKEGSFDVTLKVTDNNGETDTETMTIEVGTKGGLDAIISAPLPDEQDYVVGKSYTFSGASSKIKEGEIDSYTWDFGDGTAPVEGKNASHTFDVAGLFTVTLTVESTEGSEDTEELQITVAAAGSPPKAVIGTDQTESNNTISGSAPFEVSFDASDSVDPEDDIIEYEWDFDSDGVIDDRGSETTHTYTEEGTYEVSLTVIDAAGNQDEAVLGVKVGSQGIIAEISALPTSGEVPLTVSFDATGSSYKDGDIVSCDWDFGDGGEFSGTCSVSYKYKNTGTYTASVTVIASDGKKATDSIQVVVREVGLTACFTTNPKSGKAPLFVTVDASCSTGTIDSYEWNFDKGSGSISYDPNPDTVVYDEPGLYTITLEISTSGGVVDQVTQQIQVQ